MLPTWGLWQSAQPTPGNVEAGDLPVPASEVTTWPGNSWCAERFRTCLPMSTDLPVTEPSIALCGWPGRDAWQPVVVHENGGGSAVKFSRRSAVGAKWGVWQASQPHSLSWVYAGHVFGGRGRMPTTDAVDVAWAELVHPAI